MINNNNTTNKPKITPSFLWLIITILILVLLLQHIPTCLSQAQDQTQEDLKQWYNSCGNLYTCGDQITNISYPFWGGTRSKNCGHPSLQLQCNSTTNTTILQIEKIQYHVHDINSTDTSLKISRLDLEASNSCPTTFTDTTLDYTILDYASGYTNITILYGCPLLPGATDDVYGAPSSSVTTYLRFNCSVKGTDSTFAYVAPTTAEIEAAVDALGCTYSVLLPIQGNLEKNLISDASFSLNNSVEDGFEVVYKVDNGDCIACGATNGRCGYDLSTNVTICICSDGSLADSDNHTCGGGNTGSGDDAATTDARSSASRNIVIGVSVGAAAIAALILLCAYLFFQQRKKKRLQASNVVSGKNKDINSTTATAAYTFNSRGILQSSNGTPQSSNGYTTTPTTNSQSTSSYVSSKSDVERGGRDDSSYFGVRVFSYDELEQATSHFDEARELGDGGFGTVYYGKLPDGCLVAVKRLYENSFKRVEQFMNEVQILARLRHKNLVTLYGCTSRRSRELLLVYEYISNGTVADHIHGRLASSDSSKNNNQHHLPWLTRLNIAVETAEALAFLHASDVIHRDVKTTNILLDQNFCVKVADFGLSRLFPTDVTHVSTAPQGTPGYVDPEYYQCYRLTEKSDVYSFGVVLIELISSKQAVDITRHRHHINLSNMAVDKIQNQQLNELVDPNLGFENDCIVGRMVKGVAELAFRCLQQERDIRPTMGEVLDTLRLIQKYAVDQDHKVLQEVIVVDKSSIVCKEDEDVELLKNVPPPFSPEDLKMGVQPSS